MTANGTVIANIPAGVAHDESGNPNLASTSTDNTGGIQDRFGSFTITVVAGPGGTITPGTGTVPYGATPTYTIAPNTGYRITSVLVDGGLCRSGDKLYFRKRHGEPQHKCCFCHPYIYSRGFCFRWQWDSCSCYPIVNHGSSASITLTPSPVIMFATITDNGKPGCYCQSLCYFKRNGGSHCCSPLSSNTITVTASVFRWPWYG